MKISTKGTYGLRAMIDLAIFSQFHPVSIKKIAARQEISELYLEQIFAKLKQGGLVKSKRGIYGGYFLGKDPQHINVKEILNILEDNLSVHSCQNDNMKICQRASRCPTRVLWKRIDRAVHDIMESYTLEDLVVEAKFQDNSLL